MVGFCFTSCLFFSCKEDTSDLGLELQNPNERVLVFNDSSMQINSFTAKKLDTFSIQPKLSLDYFLLGHLNDPSLGEFTNSFLTEIDIISKPSYETLPTVDSVFIELGYLLGNEYGVYQGVYGSSEDEQVINIYDLKKDSSIFKLNSKAMTVDNLNEYVDRDSRIHQFTFKPNAKDTILKIPLPVSFGERLLDTNFYGSVDTFQNNILKGLYFEATSISGLGAITTFDYSRSFVLRLYYKEGEDTVEVNYGMNEQTWRANFFQREVNPVIKSAEHEVRPTDDLEQDVFYMKNNNTFESIIQISDLQNWADSGHFTFNKARLTLKPTYETSEDSLLGPIMNFYAFIIDDIENNNFDYTQLNEYRSSGGYSYVTFDTSCNCYNLDLNNTLYNTVESGKDTLSLLLTTSGVQSMSSPKRTVFYGANNEENPIKLNVTYTKFNE